jgi:4a-hydroxytetrahydrobiopterin dehydratase
MTRPQRLGDAEIAAQLSALSGWKVEGGKLHRTFLFRDFVAAFGFMTSAALVAQQLDHHPEWSNVWNKVQVDLVTHDAEGITALDFKLAGAMQELAGRFPMK